MTSVAMGMPGAMACPNCGSWSVKADRSLSGRMVCGRCGEPLGIGRGHPRRPWGRRSRLRRGDRWWLWLGLTALVALSAVLAGLAERRPMDRRPTQGWPAAPNRSNPWQTSATEMQRNVTALQRNSPEPGRERVAIR
jgi:hypothetical protein